MKSVIDGYSGSSIDCVQPVLGVHGNLDDSEKRVSLDRRESRNERSRANAEGGGIVFRAELEL